MVPNAINRHARGEWVLFVGNPIGQVKAAARIVREVAFLQSLYDGQESAPDFFSESLGITAYMNLSVLNRPIPDRQCRGNIRPGLRSQIHVFVLVLLQ